MWERLRPIARAVLAFAGRIALPVSTVLAILRLLPHWRGLRAAEVVVLPDRKLNFANTVRVPDAARRLYRGRRVVCLVWREPFHNPYVPLIWPDVSYLDLRRAALDVRIGRSRVLVPAREDHDRFMARVVERFVRLIASTAPIFATRSTLWAMMPLPATAERAAVEARRRDPDDPFLPQLGYAGYFHLVGRQDVAKAALPPALRLLVLDKLEGARGRRAAKLCNLYLKHAGGPDATSDGAPLVSYIPAIRRLVARGYQVLLTGDRSLPPGADRFDGMLVDSAALGIDRWLFMIFAATEADVFVGDNGGGALVSHLNPMPRLVLNVFPYFTVWSGVLHYKQASDLSGNAVPFARLVRAFQDNESIDLVVAPNSAAEIDEAVRSFFEELDGSPPHPRAEEMAALWPAHAPFHVGGARLSSAYVRSQLMMESAVPSAAQ